MKATAKIAKENALATEAERPSAPGKKDAGAKNIPNAMTVSAKVFNQSIHRILSVSDLFIIVCIKVYFLIFTIMTNEILKLGQDFKNNLRTRQPAVCEASA